LNAQYSARPFADEFDGNRVQSSLETLTRIVGSFAGGLTITALIAVAFTR
jgi:hypothetical protein